MKRKRIFSNIKEFSLSLDTAMNVSVVVPAVKGTWYMKYGEHEYSFMNFRTSKAFCVKIPHLAIIRPGWKRLRRAAKKAGKKISLFRPFSPRYNYGFNMLEQVMLMTVPHTVTSVGEGRFIINLWSWCGFLLVDTVEKAVTYHIMDETDDDSVFSRRRIFIG